VEASESVARWHFLADERWSAVGGDSTGTLQLEGGEGHVTHNRIQENDSPRGSSPIGAVATAAAPNPTRPVTRQRSSRGGWR
jgi:hypothetical protein